MTPLIHKMSFTVHAGLLMSIIEVRKANERVLVRVRDKRWDAAYNTLNGIFTKDLMVKNPEKHAEDRATHTSTTQSH